ncbi:MAG: T9SS type A sorting domain-containing protein [Bacteroidetes bacterium]|nr:T9SS type A sorting domain-containing protein [Bacteroidota bacterium]MBT6685238.1 T9SS type A sorting domain-containing protein [Bacteroidota bacterium]MBT7144386.1 T9SS type A sorting domain-containing protein [Bacteroidota bacterium]MBT7492197.1 T9SS type A sorting domain-containing protein [Bacteroidota bacterium]
MDSKKLILVFFILITNSEIVLSQCGQAFIWYFGTNAGIEFSPAGPVSILGGQLDTQEGCATICDPNGNLLFYTDGITVWNALHNQMPNGFGLFGNSSSSQSAVIVKEPLSTNTYYIFTVEDDFGFYGLRYSVVDMNLDGGLGDIVPSQKNVLLFLPACEKIAAALHQNGTDIWIIAHYGGNPNFVSYLINQFGIQSNSPMISQIGHDYSAAAPADARGYMKVSANGEKLALAIEGQNKFEVYDFNNSTGELTNHRSIESPSWLGTNGFADAYGVEFSSNGDFLYGTRRWSNQVFQWHLSGTATDIINSVQQIGTISGPYGAALQIGIDCKIYVAKNMQEYLGVIDEPNIQGNSCNYVDSAIYLQGNICKEGLPTFFAGHFTSADFFIQTGCLNDTTKFELNSPYISSVFWNFNYPSNSPQFHSTALSDVCYIYPPGTYTIQCIAQFASATEIQYQTIEIVHLPSVELGQNPSVLCSNETLEYDFSDNGDCSYFWTAVLDNYTITDSLPTFLVDKPGFYTIEISNICGTVSDSIFIEYNEIEPNLGLDISNVCFSDTQILNVEFSNLYGAATFLWSTDETFDSIFVANSGIYSVLVSVANCTEYDEITVSFDTLLNINLGQDQQLCEGNSQILSIEPTNAKLLWSTGSISQEIEISIAGTYSVIASNSCGNFFDTIIIEAISVPDFDLGANINLCEGNSTIIYIEYPNSSYYWNTGSTLPFIVVDSAGTYGVLITNQCGSGYDNVTVSKHYPIVLNLADDTTICPYDTIILDAQNSGSTFYWSNTETIQSISVCQAATYFVTVENACGIETDFTEVEFLELDFRLPNDTIICENESLILNIFDSSIVSYLWSTNEISSSIEIENQGNYFVICSDKCNTLYTDSIYVYILPETLELGNDTSVCVGNSIIIDAGFPNLNYFWSNGSSNQTIEITENGIYEQTISHPVCGNSFGSIFVDFDPVPEFEFDSDTIFSVENLPTLIDAGAGFQSYLWSNAETSQSIYAYCPGYFSVTVSNIFNCFASDSVFHEIISMKKEEDYINNITIFPNPTSEFLFINSKVSIIKNVAIFDLKGKLVYTENFNKKNIFLNISKYTTSIYRIRLSLIDDIEIVRTIIILN